MIVTKNEHSKQNFACGNATISVNLYNGNLIAEYLLGSIGINSFELTTSVSYNTNYKKTDFNGKIIGFGNGWKLNIHQYILPYLESYSIDGFNDGDYLYIDGQWNIHKFVYFYKYDETTNVYYKADNATVKLYVYNNGYRIEDDRKNKLIFNTNGELIQVVSCLNENIIKQINYEAGKIVGYYDLREPSTKLIFSYDLNNILKKVYNNKNTICYNLNFENNKLMSIEKSAGSKHKGKIENIYYSNSKIEYIINSSDKTAMKIDYLLQNDIYKVLKVYEGAVKKNIVHEKCSENYVSKNSFVSADTFLSNQFLKYKSEYYTMPEGYINNSITYSYHENYTDVTNKYGIKIRNYLNTSGQVISKLDVKTDNNYYTLQKQYGVKVPLKNTSNLKINNSNCYETTDVLLLLDNKEATNAFEKFQVTQGGDNQKIILSLYDKYSLGFWVMCDHHLQNAYVELHHTNFGCTRIERFFLENTLPNTWQYVSLEGNVFTEENSLKDMVIRYCGISDKSKIIMSDIVINGSTTPTAKMLKESDIIGESQFGVPWMSKMFYVPYDSQENLKIEENINSEYYMSENDLILTYKSMNLSHLQNKENYELYYCNCKKVLLVKDAGLVVSTEIFTDENYSNISFSLIAGKQNFYLETKVPIQDRLWNSMRYSFAIKNDSYGYYLNTKILNKKTLMFGENADNDESFVINSSYLNGLKRGNQYDNGLIIQYEYDNYGNILNIMSWNPEGDSDNNSSELISVHYEYEDSDEKYRKKAYLIYNDGSSTTYNFDNILGKTNKIVNEKNEIIYEYDGFKDNIEKITFKDKLNPENTYMNFIDYYENGYLKKLSDNNNNYGFKLNGLSELDSFYTNKELIFKNKKEEDPENIKLITIINDSNGNLDNFMEVYDKKGYLHTIKENNVDKVEFNYSTLEDCSSYFKRLDKVKDNYENSIYQYSYDGELNSYVEEVHDNFKVKLFENKLIEYYKENEDFKIQCSSRNNIINGLVEETSYAKYNNNQQYVVNGLEDFNYTYEYDGFLRLKRKVSRSNIEKSISYVPQKQLPLTINYKFDPTNNLIDINYSNTYTNNMVTKIINKNNEYLYNYDVFNRLIYESNPTFGTLTYEYDNNSRMLKKITKNNMTQCVFNYNCGKLTSLEKNDTIKNISYDKKGNIISLGDIQLTYNLRGLLETYSYNINNETIKYLYHYDYLNRRCKIEKKIINHNIETTCFTKKFFYDGNRLVREELNDLVNSSIKIFNYFYDIEGICGIRYGNNNYTFLKDSLMNVSYIIRNKELIGKYEYDAWGNIKVIAFDNLSAADAYVLNNNPFRYKGYYYDVETQLFWVSSRYYSPELCRWISPDSIEYLDPSSINGLKLYCYCFNNPIMYVDSTGHSPEWWQWLISGLEVAAGIAMCFVPGMQGFGVTLIGTGAGSIINGYINESNGGSFTAGWLGGQAGGLISAIPGIGIPLGAFVGSTITDGVDYGWDGIDWNKALVTSFVAWGFSLFPGMTGEILSKYKIYDKAIYFVNAYNTILTSTANSIVNVYWRGKNVEKRSYKI